MDMNRKIVTVLIAVLVVVLVLWDDFVPEGDQPYDPAADVEVEPDPYADYPADELSMMDKCTEVRTRISTLFGEDPDVAMRAAMQSEYTVDQLAELCVEYDSKTDEQLEAFMKPFFEASR